MSDQIFRTVRSVKVKTDVTRAGETQYFTDLADLARHLLRWRLETERADRRRYQLPGYLASVWLDFAEVFGVDRPKIDKEQEFPYTTEIVRVQRHTDAGWVDVDWSYVQPTVTINGDVLQ